MGEPPAAEPVADRGPVPRPAEVAGALQGVRQGVHEIRPLLLPLPAAPYGLLHTLRNPG